MDDAGVIIAAIQGGAGTLVKYFVNFSGEFQAIGKAITLVFAPAIGILISAWAVLDFMKLKKAQGSSSPTSVMVRFIVGPITIQLSAFVYAISESVFGERDFATAEEQLASYVSAASNDSGDPVAQGLAALLAFFVVVGWVAALRALVAFARIGSPSENGYELFRTGASRLVAATFLCMFQFFIDDIIASVGGGKGTFSSMLAL